MCVDANAEVHKQKRGLLASTQMYTATVKPRDNNDIYLCRYLSCHDVIK